MLLHLHRKIQNQLACYTMDGSYGHCGVFPTNEYAYGERGAWLDDVIAHLVVVFDTQDENSMAWILYHHNHNYTIDEIVEIANQNNNRVS